MKKYSILIFLSVVVIAVMFLSGCSGSGSSYYRSYNDSNVHWGTHYVYYDDDHDHDNRPPSMGRPERPSQLPSRPSHRPSRPRSTGRRR